MSNGSIKKHNMNYPKSSHSCREHYDIATFNLFYSSNFSWAGKVRLAELTSQEASDACLGADAMLSLSESVVIIDILSVSVKEVIDLCTSMSSVVILTNGVKDVSPLECW